MSQINYNFRNGIGTRINLIDTADVIDYNNYMLEKVNSPGFVAIRNSKVNEIANLENQLLLKSDTCTIRKLKGFLDNIHNVDPKQIKHLLKNNFYDPTIMKEIMCTMNSLVYLQPNLHGALKPNERIKEWIKNLQRIGSESAKGFAFKGDLRNADSAFVIKTPKDAKEDLIHELLVGIELNSLRAYVPNFAYVFGGFKCTPPILKQDPQIFDSRKSAPVSWCDNANKNVVQYIIYENIAPAQSFLDYVKSCTFVQFLNKYLQVVFALLIARKIKDFTHYDLHHDNVLIKSLNGEKVSIPYNNDLGNIEYLETDGISTIIDYGFGHVRLSGQSEQLGPFSASAEKGQSIGIVGYEWAGIFADKSSTFYDVYKLLMFCLQGMLQNKNFDCYQRAVDLFKFFNSTEDPQVAIEKQGALLFPVPLNQKTVSLKLEDYISYIRRNIPEYKLIMSDQPRTSRVLGCTGNDICVSSAGAIELLGYTSNKLVDNIFDFYDLVSRLEAEGRTGDIRQLLQTVDYNKCINEAVIEYNKESDKIIRYFQSNVNISVPSLSLMSERGQIDTKEFLNSNFMIMYKSFIIDTAEINESFQRLSLIYECILFLKKYYPNLEISDIIESHDIMMEYYSDFLLILDSVKNDAIYLGADGMSRLQLPELNILSNNI